ncbi:non-ribosomal peptide synthetase [Ktedonobacter robiniae]|uniref:Carrier domain-containing protein n=1 Tax=Ktedonobacter robiniae TaxID=2778365 RepID=A0ABQ3UZZ4_9CHLR|nr:non-ribosomal peptide synthetase [Ktedonobacter robiniae]GHO57935.1 hypothetical protein KSB_64100 [Ktedonobacter robiniae]
MQMADLKGSRLSLQQTRLWSLQPEPQIFRVQCSILLGGSFNSGVMQRALREIVARHEILRTAFRQIPGVDMPIQVIAEQAEATYKEYALEELGEQAQQEALDRLFMQEREAPFDFSQSSLLRVSLVRLHTTRHVLLLSLPALCADAVSLRLLTTLLLRTYKALIQQQELDDEPLQYVDVAAWQRELLQQEDAEEHMLFWKRFATADFSCVSLPYSSQDTDVTAPPTSIHPQEQSFTLDAGLSVHLLTGAREHNLSCEALLLACWQLLQWRFTNNPQIVLGYLSNGRAYEDLSDALGAYSRVVPLCSTFHPQRTFAYLAQQCQRSLEAVQEHQDYFSWSLLNQSNEHILPLGFSFDAWPAPTSEEVFHWQLLRSYHLFDHSLLHLRIIQHAEAFSCALVYDPQTFTQSQVQRLIRSFLHILHLALAQPQRMLAGWPLVEDEEQQELLQRFRGTPPADTRSILQCFESHVARHPDQPALRCGEVQMSYQQLNMRANQLAHWLRRAGVRTDALVGLYLERGEAMLIGVLGVLKSGGAYVPLDPAWPQERLHGVLEELTAPIVLTQETVSTQLPTGPWQVKYLDECSWLDGELESNLEEADDEQTLAYVLYTSGSTGKPKGVEVRRGGLRHYVAALREVLQPQDGWQYALVSTLAADLGNTVIYGALTSGGCLHILRYETLTQSTDLTTYMQHYAIDVLKIVPSHLQALLADSPEKQALLPNRHLLLGGEVLTWDLLAEIQQMGAQCMVWNHYGPTETTVGVLLQALGSAHEIEKTGQGVPLGRPLGGNAISIVDAWQQVAPVGVIGELCIAGDGLARGYLGRARETAERFVPDPYAQEPGARMYRTGDLARYGEHGELEFIGRADRQVKIRGYRVEPGEIEATLRKHERVLDAIVQMREGRLIGYVRSQQPLPERQELREWVNAYLPEYMVPAAFVRLLAWPLTTNGKIDLYNLPEPEDEEERVIVIARTPIEELLVQIWREVLGIQSISIYDNFFYLDGHSLLATQVISRVRQAFDASISIRQFFEEPTIVGLATRVAQALRGEQELQVAPLVPQERGEEVQLSFAQQRLWFLAQLDPQSAAYNLPHALRLHGPLQVDVLEASFHELVRRHESLRTTFPLHEGQPVQRIHPPNGPVVRHIHLEQQNPEQREQEVLRQANEEAQRPFDLGGGPLLRVTLLHLGKHEYVLLLTLHHIISDGWSSNILVRELLTLYAAFAQGEPTPLSELSVQYADYAVWQRQWLQGAILQQQEDYWRNQLADITPLALPTDFPRPPEQTTRGTVQTLRLSEELSQGLRALSQQEGVTLFMLLLAGFQILLGRYSGQDDIVVGTPIANRTQAEVEDLIGFFVNTLVLRTDLSGSPTVREVVRRVREVSLGAYAHQDLPFEYLVERLQPERDRSRHAFFQVMFMVQHVRQQAGALQDIVIDDVEVKHRQVKFDLALTVQEWEQELTCVLEYRTDLFAETSIERLLFHWQRILEAMVRTPEEQIEHLPLLSAQEREQALYTWNQASRPVPVEMVPQLLVRQALATPQALAVWEATRALNYQELLRQARRLAAHLKQLGVGAEQVVGVYMERSVDLVVSLLGVWLAGGAYLPLEPGQPLERLRYQLKDAGAHLVITGSAQQEQAQGLQTSLVCLEDALAEHEEPAPLERGEITIQPEQLAYVIYTSGSTGAPKGVGVTHANLGNLVAWYTQCYQVTTADRVTQLFSQGFDPVAQDVWPTLVRGASIWIVDEETRLESERLQEWLREHEITMCNAPTPLTEGLLALNEPSMGVLRHLGAGGEQLRRYAPEGTAYRLHNFYGPTEGTVIATTSEVVTEGEARGDCRG